MVKSESYCPESLAQARPLLPWPLYAFCFLPWSWDMVLLFLLYSWVNWVLKTQLPGHPVTGWLHSPTLAPVAKDLQGTPECAVLTPNRHLSLRPPGACCHRQLGHPVFSEGQLAGHHLTEWGTPLLPHSCCCRPGGVLSVVPAMVTSVSSLQPCALCPILPLITAYKALFLGHNLLPSVPCIHSRLCHLSFELTENFALWFLLFSRARAFPVCLAPYLAFCLKVIFLVCFFRSVDWAVL